MLNPVAKKWVAALRSGKYVQGRGQLKRDNKYCCLGVLADIALQEGHYTPPDGRFYLPLDLLPWSGLKDTSGTYRKEGQLCSLAADNDKIADIIESEPQGLFQQGWNERAGE